VLLLTGATGRIGSALLERLLERGDPVRCLVRDPRRLGRSRVRVQIALGDLADPSSFRHALRGVDVVVHLAGAWRDQPGATLEELNGLATWRLLRAAEQAGAGRLLHAVPLGAGPYHPLRVHRAKALAQQAAERAALPTTAFRLSLTYGPDGRAPGGLERLALAPVQALPGRGDALVQPIAAADVAACILAALDAPTPSGHAEHELAGPDRMTQRERLAAVARATGRRRAVLPVPVALLRPLLQAHEALAGPPARMTWDEAALATVDMLSVHGTAGAEALGVRPRPLREVLGG
jgi:NADH dehydrogenase